MKHGTGKLSKITARQIFVILTIVFLSTMYVLGMQTYAKRRVGWAGVRYELYEDGKPKKRLTYGFGAKLIKVENYDINGNIISVENFK